MITRKNGFEAMSLIATSLFTAAMVAPACSVENADQALPPKEPTFVGETANPAEEASAQSPFSPLAILTVADGHTVSFLRNGDGAFAVSEMASLRHEGVAPLMTDSALLRLEPLEAYLALTPADRPVPEALLAASESPRVLAQARLRETVPGPLEAMPAHLLQLRSKEHPTFPAPELCGSNGTALFQDICDANSDLDETFCSPFLHASDSRSSSNKHRHGAVVTVSCGSSVTAEVWRKIALTWYKDDIDLPADEILLVFHVWYDSSYFRKGKAFAFNSVDTSFNTIRTLIAFWGGG
jgi:hypothetical protein